MGQTIVQNSRNIPQERRHISSHQKSVVGSSICLDRQSRHPDERSFIYCGCCSLCAQDEQAGIDTRRIGNCQRVSNSSDCDHTANGSIDGTEEATVYVKDLDTFDTVQLFEDISVFSVGTPWWAMLSVCSRQL